MLLWYTPSMPPKSRESKSSKRSLPESTVIQDFAQEDGADFSEIPEFDRAMRGLVQVPKSDVDAAIKKENSRKRKRSG
jgi:hypothetical protein